MITLRQEPDPQPGTAESKERGLSALMRRMGRVLVAYSGGVDSTYLAYVARRELGSDAVCVLGVSPSVAAAQRSEAERIANELGLDLRIIETGEMDDPNYTSNPSNRCYFCKTELYGKLAAVAADLGFPFVVDGANADDVADYRPGRVAAAEKSVRSPLIEAGMSKEEIRTMSRLHGIVGWDKPASPCLSSRIAHGVPVTIERLSRIERGEDFLRSLGFREFRLRSHGDLARVEIAAAELPSALDAVTAASIAAELRDLGFRYVTLDLEGFRSGSMNAPDAAAAG